MTTPTQAPQTLDADGYRDQLRGFEVKCKLCGFKAHALTKHLRDAHNISPGQYQKQFPKDQNPDAKLFSPVAAELLKNFNRYPRPSAAFEDNLPAYEDVGGLMPSITAMAATMPRGQALNGAFIPDPNPDFWFDEPKAIMLGAAMTSSMNAYLVGPTGCGKTDIAYQLHARLKKPMIRINMHGDATHSKIVGEMKADPVRGTYFHEGALPTAMKMGATLLVDEVDYAPPHILSLFNPVLEDKRTIFLEETNETVTAAPGFMVVATANTTGKGDDNGNYTGTEILNTAFLDRFPFAIKMDYLPEDVEIRMLEGRCSEISKAEITKLVKFAREVRDAFVKGNLPLTLSTRKLIDICRVQKMIGMEKAVEAAVLNWYGEDELQVVKGFATRVGIPLAQPQQGRPRSAP